MSRGKGGRFLEWQRTKAKDEWHRVEIQNEKKTRETIKRLERLGLKWRIVDGK